MHGHAVGERGLEGGECRAVADRHRRPGRDGGAAVAGRRRWGTAGRGASAGVRTVDAQGRPRTLVDQGWTIDYTDYTGEAPDALPRRARDGHGGKGASAEPGLPGDLDRRYQTVRELDSELIAKPACSSRVIRRAMSYVGQGPDMRMAGVD